MRALPVEKYLCRLKIHYSKTNCDKLNFFLDILQNKAYNSIS